MKWNHVGIKSANVERSLDFYCKVLGLRLIDSAEILGKKFIFVGNDSISIEIEQCNPSDTQANASSMTGLNHISLTIEEDIHACVKRLKERNAKIVLEPLSPRPDRMVSFIEDPDGVLIQIIMYV